MSSRTQFVAHSDVVFSLMFHPDLNFLCDDSAAADALMATHGCCFASNYSLVMNRMLDLLSNIDLE